MIQALKETEMKVCAEGKFSLAIPERSLWRDYIQGRQTIGEQIFQIVEKQDHSISDRETFLCNKKKLTHLCHSFPQRNFYILEISYVRNVLFMVNPWAYDNELTQVESNHSRKTNHVIKGLELWPRWYQISWNRRRTGSWT